VEDGLERLGWDAWFEQRWSALGRPGPPARVARVDRGWSTLWTGGEPGRVRNLGADVAVGDWVVASAEEDRVAHVLDRRSAFVRRRVSRGAAPDVVVANVDVAFLLHALPGAPNARRLERELVLAFASGATPVVVLTKADLAPSPASALDVVRSVAPTAEVLVVSAHQGTGIEELAGRLARHRTIALIGASGVGKSTLVNALVGDDVQRIGAVRGDRKGRHTTTAAELVLAGDGVVADTPGLRTLGLWDAERGIDAAFPDVAGRAADCRFDDCRHDQEPGCAVREAVAPARLAAYRHLRAELDELDLALTRHRPR
jgi:ribosome biogenesis GTPase